MAKKKNKYRNHDSQKKKLGKFVPVEWTNYEQSLIKYRKAYEKIDEAELVCFDQLPIHKRTIRALTENKYLEPTPIQRDTIKHCLLGRDVFGLAPTGSGKTLAFLVPLLEILNSHMFTPADGVGAIIMTPTRELALQIFEVLNRVGKYHMFSAALIIGGQNLIEESSCMDRFNIIVCTPGRLLQHLDETPNFYLNNLKILVLDEVDMCLERGFRPTLTAILDHLPAEHQSILFSATKPKTVEDLVVLSLKDPKFISVYPNAEALTSSQLEQRYVVCQLKDKVSVLWSFLESHLNKKVIIFFATCKEAKFLSEIYALMRPKATVFCLQGNIKYQVARIRVYKKFVACKKAFLFATNLASRGLDFPSVDWVVHFDCPEDIDTYIHRAGRTARYKDQGNSFLMLLDSERTFIDELRLRNIQVEESDINPEKLQNPTKRMAVYIVRYPELKATAHRAIIAYAKDIYNMKNKKVFDVRKLDLTGFALSFGLVSVPRVRFLERKNKQIAEKQAKNKTDDEAPDELDNNILIEELPIINSNEKSNPKHLRFDDDYRKQDVEMDSVITSNINENCETQPVSFNQLFEDLGYDDMFNIGRKNIDIELPSDEETLVKMKRRLDMFNNEQAEKTADRKRKKREQIESLMEDKPKKIVRYGFDLDAQPPEIKLEMNSDFGRKYQLERDPDASYDYQEAFKVLRAEYWFDRKQHNTWLKERRFEERKRLKEEYAKKKAERAGKLDEYLDDLRRRTNEELGIVEAPDIDGDEDSEDEWEPDISWLPDPDVVYKNEENETYEVQGNINMNETEMNALDQLEKSTKLDTELVSSIECVSDEHLSATLTKRSNKSQSRIKVSESCIDNLETINNMESTIGGVNENIKDLVAENVVNFENKKSKKKTRKRTVSVMSDDSRIESKADEENTRTIERLKIDDAESIALMLLKNS